MNGARFSPRVYCLLAPSCKIPEFTQGCKDVIVRNVQIEEMGFSETEEAVNYYKPKKSREEGAGL